MDVSQLDAKEAKAKTEEADRQAQREAEKREAEEKAAASREAARKHEELKEANREKIEELKQDYYLRKAKRERWEAFRAENKSRGTTNDYYRGWDFFEDDPDEELFSGDNPAGGAGPGRLRRDGQGRGGADRTPEGRQGGGRQGEGGGQRGLQGGAAHRGDRALLVPLEHFKGDKAALALARPWPWPWP